MTIVDCTMTRRNYNALLILLRSPSVSLFSFLVYSTFLRRLNSTIAVHVAAAIFQGWRSRAPSACSSNLQLEATDTTISNGTILFSESVQGGFTSVDIDHSPAERLKHSRPERGKLLPNIPNAHDLYDAYKSIQSEYQEKAFHNENQWKVLRSAEDVTVSILHHETDPSCPYVKMEGIMPVPVQQCWNFLNIEKWDKNMPKMDPFYEGVSNYGEYNVSIPLDLTMHSSFPNSKQKHSPKRSRESTRENIVRMILCRKRMLRILTFGKRDLVFLSCSESEPLPDGSLVSGTVSVRTAMVPRMKGYTRAFQDSIAFYRPLQNNTKTYVFGAVP
jgi:hypothetical protein